MTLRRPRSRRTERNVLFRYIKVRSRFESQKTFAVCGSRPDLCENHSPWLDAPRSAANSEMRIIPADCLGSDNDSIDDRSKLLCMSTRRFRSKPPRFPWGPREMSVQTHPALRDYKWFAGDNPFVKAFIKSRALLFQNASCNIDAAST